MIVNYTTLVIYSGIYDSHLQESYKIRTKSVIIFSLYVRVWTTALYFLVYKVEILCPYRIPNAQAIFILKKILGVPPPEI